MLVDLLRAQPIAAVFLTLALGTLLGRLGFRKLHLGTVPATLLVTVIAFSLYIINTSMESVFNPRLRR